MRDKAGLRELLEDRHLRYNTPAFIESDPIFVPHQFEKKEDIEISGFLTALIAWGRRSSILQNAWSLMERMDFAPHQFITQYEASDLSRLEGFVHRTFNEVDCMALIQSLQAVYTEKGGLEEIFVQGLREGDLDCKRAIVHAREVLVSDHNFPTRTHKHIANPAKGSAAKRINMFLRWMVRVDAFGVDFGLWKRMDPAQLICPLDVHTGNVARALGLLQRKQNDWLAADQLTTALREFCPEDPVKYDFSLFGLGVYEDF